MELCRCTLAEPARVRFQARLDPRGALRDVVANMPESPRVAACLAERLGAVRLPRYRGDSRLVRFSLALRGDER